MNRVPGFATPEGTARYKSRFEKALDPLHFRLKNNLWFSSIGIGSYLGEPDDETDRLYEEALREAVLSGINVIDSAINYRAQRSERCFGKTLASLIHEEKIRRDEIILCTKGGFLPFDGSYPADAELFFEETYVKTGLLRPEEIAQGCHAMTPKYLEDQLTRSLKNLGVETVDIYYLHNPETQLEEKGRAEFLNRTRAAFQWLEEKVREGKIRMYGTATWNGYRVMPDAPDYLSIEEMNCLAREVAGAEHHFKVIQLPYNLAMPEAWIAPNQSLGANRVSLLNVAARDGMIVVGSGSLMQGRLAGPLPEALKAHFKPLTKSSQQALQFARSAPGLTTSLVGMKTRQHVTENLEAAKVPPLTESQLITLFS